MTNEEIYDYVSHGDVQRLRQALEDGYSVVGRKDNDSSNILQHAVDKNENTSVELIQLLVDAGMDLEITNGRSYWTPLNYAYSSCNDEVIMCLLLNGANLKPTDHGMCYARNPKATPWMTQILLDAGMDINHQDEDFDSAFLIACMHCNEEVIEYLLDKDGDIHTSNYKQFSVLMACCRNKKVTTRVIQRIIDAGVDINHRDRYEQTVLHEMISTGNEEAIECLLDNGVDVNTTTDGFTPLMLYTHGANATPRMIQRLIDAGVDINHRNGFGQTVLHEMISTGNEEAIECLLDNGVDVNTTIDGFTPIMLYIHQDNASPRMIQRFIDAGVDINHRDDNGWTSLIIAIANGNDEAIEFLLDNGVDVNSTTDGFTPLMLYTHGANATPSIIQRIQRLIDAGVDINHRNGFGQTVLHEMISTGNEEAIECLLDNGVDVNTTIDGFTPIMLYIHQDNASPRMIQRFIDAGADINYRDDEGRNAYYYAITKENKEVIECLLENGAEL